MPLADIVIKKRREELRLFLSAALAGFILELPAVRVTGIYRYSPDFWISIGFQEMRMERSNIEFNPDGTKS